MSRQILIRVPAAWGIVSPRLRPPVAPGDPYEVVTGAFRSGQGGPARGPSGGEPEALPPEFKGQEGDLSPAPAAPIPVVVLRLEGRANRPDGATHGPAARPAASAPVRSREVSLIPLSPGVRLPGQIHRQNWGGLTRH